MENEDGKTATVERKVNLFSKNLIGVYTMKGETR